jgi:hypothetical protein
MEIWWHHGELSAPPLLLMRGSYIKGQTLVEGGIAPHATA